MTLSVDAYRLDADGTEIELPIPSYSAGVEATRRTFYDSQASIKLGLKLLPRLNGEAMLEIGGQDLPVLIAEVDILLRSLSEDASDNYWRLRLGNIRTAAEVASAFGDSGFVRIG